MKLTIETSNSLELEQILELVRNLHLEHKIHIDSNKKNTLPIQKGDRSLDPRASFGIWKDNPRTIEQFRKEGWERNWNL
jgi:hypothetical protein